MLLALLAITVAYFIPLDVYVPEIERVLGTNLHDPVKIRHLKIGVIPVPHLVLEDVRVGEHAGLALQSVRIVPNIRSLFEAQRVISHVVLKSGSVTQEQLEKILVLLQSGNVAVLPFRIEEVQFNDIRLTAPKYTLGPMEGKLEFKPDSSLERAWFAIDEQKITATVRPQPSDAYAVEVQANTWSPPNYPSIVLDKLHVNGILSKTQFNAKKFSAEAYGAHLNGGALLEWKPEWKLAIRLDVMDGRVERLLPLLGNRVKMTGSLSGKGRLSTHGAEMQALPGNLRFDASVEIRNVTMPAPPSFQRVLALDTVNARLSGTLAEYTLHSLEVKLYGGAMSGSATMRSAGTVLDANVALTNMAIQPLVEAFNNEVKLTGTLDGKAKFTARLNEFDHFPQNMKLDGEFSVRDGVLGKVDLVQVASNPMKEGNKGGTTRFNELSSLIFVDASGYHFKKLKVLSGALNAEGRLDISPQQQLDGLLDTELKGTATLISMPLAISGTLNDPVVRPTVSALAGAVAGTALLGPGLGTALGVKAGNLFNKLFGKKNKRTEEKKEIIPKK